jgi:hypothetical protein
MGTTFPGVSCISSTTSPYIFGASLISLILTSQYQSVVSTIAQSLPPVPATAADAIRDNLNKRPVFFGCNPTNTQAPEWPLLIYIPNAPPSDGESPVTNTDTFKLSYNDKHSLNKLSTPICPGAAGRGYGVADLSTMCGCR